MIFNKIISVISAMAILITSVPQVGAENQNYESGNMQSSTELSGLNDLEIGGTDTFGNLLANELSDKSAEQEENNGYNIFSVDVEGTTARVSFETLQDCTLLVAVYDNDNIEMAASGYTEVTTEDTEIEVEIGADTLPEYFYIRAYLINTDTLRPLSVEYTSPMYTKEMQEFLSKTVDDFDSYRVINFDENKDTNFGVFEEGIAIIPEISGKNTVISADDETLTYKFGNVDEKITSLKAGDIFAYDYQDSLLIVKVKTVSVSGTNAVVIGQELDLEEVFEHLRIDGEVNSDKAEIDDSNMDEGVSCEGLVDDFEENGISPNALDVTGKSSKSIKFSIYDKKAGNFELSSDLNVKLGSSVKVYLSFSEIYVEFKLDLTAKLSLEFEVSLTVLKKELRLAYIAVYICPGVYFSVTPEFVLELSGKASVEGTLSATVGFKVSKSGIENLSSPPKFEAKGAIEVTVFIGFLLKPALSVVHEKVFNLSLESKAGAEITAKVEASTENIDPTCIHECKICIAGEIKGKFSIDIAIKLLDTEKLTFKLSLLEVSVHLKDFYISKTFNNEFAFTTCPHYKYQTFLTVKNKEAAYINGVSIIIDNNELLEYTTKGKGEVELWLTKGKHKVELDAANYEAKATSINVKEGGKRFTVIIKKVGEKDASDLLKDILDEFKSGSSNPGNLDYGKAWDLRVKWFASIGEHTAALTSEGSLYMWGNNGSGQLGDGTRMKKITPIKIMDNVSSVSLGYDHSAVITDDGSLYMWGDNSFGCIGCYGEIVDGNMWHENQYVPIKIMDNVSSVSLGDNRSAAITDDGALYTWGYNDWGELGNGTAYESTCTPIKIMDNVSSVSFGYRRGAAITDDGCLYMWGLNHCGQIGDGTTEDKYTPIKIMDNVSSVSLGDCHNAAITFDGSLYTWGNNEWGQLGDGTMENKCTPIKIMDDVSTVSLGFRHSSAITNDGSLYMWGDNSYGCLGLDNTEHVENKNVPTKIMDNVFSVSLGEWYSAAITDDGSLYMWGINHSGELGIGKSDYGYYYAAENTPTKIMDNVSSVYLCRGYKQNYSAAITSDGSLYTWGSFKIFEVGNNFNGHLGNGTTEGSPIPVKIDFPTGGEANNPNSENIPAACCSVSYNSTPSVIKSLLPNEVYNIYSVNSRTVNKELAPDNLLYIGQAVSDSNGTLAIPSAAQNGTVFVKAMSEFDVYNAPITSAEVSNSSVSLEWEPLEGASEYEVYCYTTDGILSQTKTAATSLTINNLEKGKYYGFLVTSTVHGEQSVPAINDVRMVYISDSVLGDVNSDGKITTVDAKWVLQAVSGSRTLTPEQIAAADVNGDGKITTVDAKWILQAVSGSRELQPKTES